MITNRHSMLSQTESTQWIRSNIPIAKIKHTQTNTHHCILPYRISQVPAFRTTQLLLWDEGWTGWGRGKGTGGGGGDGEKEIKKNKLKAGCRGLHSQNPVLQ